MDPNENGTTDMINEMLSDYEPKNDEVVEGDESNESESDVEEDVEEETSEETADEETGEAEAESDGEADEEDSGDEEEESEKLSETERLKQQVEKLQNIINQSQFQTTEAPKADETPSDETPDFFGEWTYEDIIEDESNFKKFLGEFADKIKTWTQNEVSKTLPNKVSSQVLSQVSIQERVKSFYDEHKPLAKVRPYVAQITGQVSREHPDWDTDKVLNETAKRAYDALGLDFEEVRDGVKKGKQKNVKKPAFASTKGGSKKSKPKKSDLERQLEDLMEI